MYTLKTQHIYAFILAALSFGLIIPFINSFIIDYDYYVMGKTAYGILSNGSYTFSDKYTAWFPPFMSGLLAFGVLLGEKPLTVVTIYNAICLAITTVYFFRILREFKIQAIWAFVMALFIPINANIIMVHTLVNSDALFYALLTVGNYHLLRYLNFKKNNHLIILSAAIGLASLQKSSVLSIVAIYFFMLILDKESCAKNKVKSLIMLCTFSLIPQILWIIRNIIISLPPLGRDPLSASPLFFDWQRLFAAWQSLYLHYSDTMEHWKLGLYAFSFFILLLITYFFVQLKHRRESAENKFILILFGQMVAIALSTTYAYYTYDSNIQFDDRISLPLIINALIITFIILTRAENKKSKYFICCIILVALEIRFHTMLSLMQFHYEERLSGRLKQITTSKIIPKIDQMIASSPETVIFTNRPHLLFGQLHPSAKVFKLKPFDPSIGEVDKNLVSLPQKCPCYLWKTEKFGTHWIMDEVISWERIKKLVNLEMVDQDEYGKLYRIIPKQR